MTPAPENIISLEKERKEVLPIIAALIAAVAPHVAGLPLWINLWCFTMWGYMLARLKTGWPLPTAVIRYLLTFAGLAGLLLTFRRGIGGDAFVGLMALMAAIKPFEMPSHRHRMITILLTYFMIITSLFRSDSLFTLIYMLFSVYVTTTAMVRINSPGASFSRSRKLAGTILAQALPMVAVLFLVFPRLPDSVFGIQDPDRGRSGFTDSLQPGRISAMARDNTPAFRVTFKENIPAPEQLYWRGIVFEKFDGSAWRPAPDWETVPVPSGQLSATGTGVSHTIIMEPSNSRRLMALDRPVQGPPWAVLGNRQTLKSRKKIIKKTQYTVVSQLSESGNTGLTSPIRLAEQILAGTGPRNPRTLALARKIAEKEGTTVEKARHILDYFRENPFVYALNAPLTGPHPLDTFIFDTRRGYCEHYASAFAFMLNGAGIPARVVGGYLGGELNPFGAYLIVRQAYAHAWVEFFDPDRGWTRMDPTGAVSPERVLVNPDGSPSGSAGQQASIPMTARLKFALDAVNLKWESWFTGYSHLEQQAWLAASGIIRGNRAAAPALAGLTLAGLALFLFILVRRFRKESTPADPVARAMGRFYKKTEQAGMPPRPGQGPADFAQMCTAKRPDLANDITAVMDLYLALRYKKEHDAAAQAELTARIQQFNPASPPEKEYS
ncbi:MAG: DUF3488 domain-containing transglutaminase family protein [Desulfobacter sp.]|nr:MAG: DUF3488 domain-containing transglutaminase family protein [Desulfobacter sp.]